MREAARSLESGSMLGPYEVLAPLGAGGMGEVYRARDPRLEREVALKVLISEVADDRHRLERFQREAKALAALKHPSIVTIHSVEEADGIPFLTMELVEGTTLKALIRRGGMKASHFFDIAIPLADALAAAHERGIVHRDLKPGNIMVTADSRIKVLDFGLAKRTIGARVAGFGEPSTESMTAQGTLLGTAPYMSPEQTQGKPVDARSDIFSLGVLFHEMLSGARPFEGEDLASLVSAILRDDPEPIAELRPELPGHLGRIVRRCLHKDPERRYQTSKDVRNELEELFRETTTERRGPTRRGIAGRPPWWLAASSVVIVALAIALATMLTRERPPPNQLTVPTIRSLAVLPLENLSGDREHEYFADGMTEALIADLAQISSLRVISRTSVMTYKGTRDKSLPEIAEALGVDAVVEGSAVRSGGRVRITAQLIHAPSDRHLWARSYEREIGDVLSLQSEVARAIASEIRVELTAAEEGRLSGSRSVVPAAYDAFLRGQYHRYSLNPEELERAQEYFDRALEIDSSFALAYVGLSNIWGGRVQWGGISPAVGMPKVRELALRAIELDDALPEAHDLVAKVYFYSDWDWPAAEREFRRGIELGPSNPSLRMTYSLLLGSLKRHDEGFEQIERAMELDPLNLLWRAVRGYQLQMSDRFDEAIENFRYTLAAGPGLLPAQFGLWSCLRREGRYQEAWVAGKKVFSLKGDHEVVEAMNAAYLETDRGEAAYGDAMRSAAARLGARSAQAYVQPSLIARLYAHAGEHGRAMEWLGRAFEARDNFLVHLAVDPDWDDLRADPQFRDFIERLKLPE